MMKVLQKVSRKVYPVCGIFLAAVLLFMLGTEAICRMSGKVEERSLKLEDFDPVEVELPGNGTVITAGLDPQLILNEPGMVRGFKLQAEFSADPGEFQVYYATKPGVYSEKQKVYAEYVGDGWYLFELPYRLRPIQSLRMDLGVSPSITVSLGEMVLNTPDTLEAWTLRMVPWFFYTVVAVAVLRAGTGILCEYLQDRQKSKNVG